MERQKYNLELLISQMQIASLKKNKILTTDEFKKSYQLYKRGIKWQQFVEMCNFGLSVNHIQKVSPIERTLPDYRSVYTRSDLIGIGKASYNSTGHIPTIQDIKQSGTITKLWQSWTDYLLACGFETNNIRLYRKQELITRNLQLLGIKMQRIPFKSEFVHSDSATRLFGSWDKAVEACGFILTLK